MPTIVIVVSPPRAPDIGDGRAEEHLVAIFLLRRVDHLGGFEPLRQKTDAAVDLAQPALAIDIVAIFRAVAVAGRPGDGLDHFRALDPQQGSQLVLQLLPAVVVSCSS